MFDGSDFPKQGVKSVGVARQYCGALGRIANCQAGVFLAHVGPRGRALADKRLYLPEEWTSDADRCVAAGVSAERREYRTKTDLALEMLRQAWGYLSAHWVAGDSASGMSPSFRDGLAAAGMWYVLDVRPDMTVWPLEPAWSLLGACLEQPGLSGIRPPPQAQAGGRATPHHERRTMVERSDELPEVAWREITVAEGTQGPRTYMFSAQRVRVTKSRVTKRRKPGEELWAIFRRNLDGSEPRYYLSNAPEDTPLDTLAYVGGSRWRIETEFETERATWDWTNTRREGRLASPYRSVPAGRGIPVERRGTGRIRDAHRFRAACRIVARFSGARSSPGFRPPGRTYPGPNGPNSQCPNDFASPSGTSGHPIPGLDTLAYVGGSRQARWRIETEFETEQIPHVIVQPALVPLDRQQVVSPTRIVCAISF